jgi:hypothetical protein
MSSMNAKKSLLAGFAPLIIALPAAADKCESLEAAIRAAPSMDSLKLSPHTDNPEMFDTKWKWGPADDCFVADQVKPFGLVSCSSPAKDGPTALEDGQKTLHEAEACLVRSLRKYKTSPWGHHESDKYGISEHGVFLLLGGSEPDRYFIVIKALAHCNTENECTSSMSVYTDPRGVEEWQP